MNITKVNVNHRYDNKPREKRCGNFSSAHER
jgi:hypothetical protein